MKFGFQINILFESRTARVKFDAWLVCAHAKSWLSVALPEDLSQVPRAYEGRLTAA